ncbi:uncharacterized protein LOC142537550 [Primulina tabacum]|uniref:uncharacterized protein LOC142537550 n=1 Tax=Primulina tabacum TaxID=48773 RepID=UPI003F596C3C
MRHSGECYRNTGACFKCGKLGHQIADGPENKEKRVKPNVENHKPRENNPNATVFVITQEEVDNSNDVVSGTILINKMHAYVLFDCGATHLFVSKRFAKKLKLEGETLSEPLRVAKPARKTIETYKTPNHDEIIYNGRSKKKKSLLSASQTWKAMKSGDEIYLAMINEINDEVTLKIEEIPVIQEFSDVFPEELPGTIPDREVEFEINMIPGAAPISKAPY